jgi:hypothetical protein
MSQQTAVTARLTLRAAAPTPVAPAEFARRVASELERDTSDAGGLDGLPVGRVTAAADALASDGSTQPTADVDLVFVLAGDVSHESAERALRAHLIDRDFGVGGHLATDVAVRRLDQAA